MKIKNWTLTLGAAILVGAIIGCGAKDEATSTAANTSSPDAPKAAAQKAGQGMAATAMAAPPGVKTGIPK
jgi:hypothetical protein